MTGYIPETFVQTLLARIDITDVISDKVSIKRAGANYITRCPFHVEKTPSFTVSPSKQFYHCFGCGASGDAIKFLMEHDGLHFVEAVELLASRVGLVLPVEAVTQITTFRDVYTILGKASEFYQIALKKHPTASKAHGYLKNRGLTGKTAKLFHMGFAPSGWDNLLQHMTSELKISHEDLLQAGLIIKKEKGGYYDRFRDRVMFPIRNRRGQVVGFGGRVIGQGEPKYLNSPETPVFSKGSELYGLYEARTACRSLTSLLVVEGYMDVVCLAHYGFKNVVATLGTALTDKHVEVLFRQASELIFCFDGDKAGREAAHRALPLLLPQMKEGRRVQFMLLPPGEDPDSLVRKVGQKGFAGQLQKAKPLSDFLFDYLSADLNLNHLDNRAQLVARAKPLIAQIPKGVFQQMLYDRLGELAGIEPELIQEKNKFFNSKNSLKPRNTWGDSFKKLKTRSVLASPAHRALALLLENRELLTMLGYTAQWNMVDTPGIELLCASIEILKNEPSISFEEIRNRLTDDLVEKLNSVDLKAIASSVPKTGITQEFQGALQRLSERSQEQAMEMLLKKATMGTLSQEEKVHLRDLLDTKEKGGTDWEGGS